MTMDGNYNSSHPGFSMYDNRTESLADLNARYARALLPLTVTFGFFTLLGFVGNGIILIVFLLSRDYKRNNFKVFVVTLGVIDLITCVTLIPAEMVKQRHYFAFGDATSCKVKCFFNVFGASASCLALLVISVDRYRKVVQPFRKQLNPKLAMRILFVVAFIVPILLAIPGTIMCGIKTSNMTNIYGGQTEIHLCETEERFQYSIWRQIYKWVFVLLMVGISFTYIILYTFVMKEAAKQIKAIKASQRKTSGYDVTLSSGIYDPNTIVKESVDNQSSMKKLLPPETSPEEDTQNGTGHNNSNGSLQRVKEHGSKKVSKQFSIRSLRGHAPILQRQGFPTKTIIWFILTIVFIVSYITHLAFALKVAGIVLMSPSEFATFSFFFRIYFFNHMINPVVYAIFVKRFRKSLLNLLPSLRKKLMNCCFS